MAITLKMDFRGDGVSLSHPKVISRVMEPDYHTPNLFQG